jgi:hypothetical protein
MKTLKRFGSILGMIALLVAVFIPDLMGSELPYIGAASFITSSIQWEGLQTFDYFLKPMFVGKTPWETQGVRVIPNVKDKLKLNYFGAAQKVLKAYAKGFNAATGVAYTQRDLETVRLKAEMSEDGLAFYQTVFEYSLTNDDWNNISGTVIEKIVVEIYKKAIMSDVFRIFWLAAPYAENLTLGMKNGVANTDYNMLKGIWQLIFENAATSPTADQIKRIAVADGAVAQVQTVTLSVDAAGTGNLTIMGKNYLVTRDTDAKTTFDNFRAANTAALALRGLTLSGTTTLVVTAAIPGEPFAAITWTGVSGTAACTIAATTPNTAPSALSAGESEDIFLSLYTGAPKELKEVPKNERVFLVDDETYENYETYLETLGVSESFRALVNGTEFLTYRGIPIINMGWNSHLDADFPHASGSLHAYPHRVIYTHIYNLVLGIDTMSQYNGFQFWFNQDEEENRARVKLVMGANYVHPKLMAVAY